MFVFTFLFLKILFDLRCCSLVVLLAIGAPSIDIVLLSEAGLMVASPPPMFSAVAMLRAFLVFCAHCGRPSFDFWVSVATGDPMMFRLYGGNNLHKYDNKQINNWRIKTTTLDWLSYVLWKLSGSFIFGVVPV